MINDTKKEANIIIENSRTRCRNNIFIQQYIIHNTFQTNTQLFEIRNSYFNNNYKDVIMIRKTMPHGPNPKIKQFSLFELKDTLY